MKKDTILLNNLFSGEYIEHENNIGGEIINIYQSDNGKFYIYVNPYGNINKKWDNKIKYILFIRSVGNGMVKVIGKAEIKKQISLNAVKLLGKGIDAYQKKYIDSENITYGSVKVYKIGSWSNYFVTFESNGIYKAKSDIYLTTNKKDSNPQNIFHLDGISRINNQSQKLYIEPKNKNYSTIEKIIQNSKFWHEKHVGKVNTSIPDKEDESFLAIIKKENDELVISNLLVYFLKKIWSKFAKEVLKINNKKVINNTPKIVREKGNIDIFIEVANTVIVIENKIKSRISTDKKKGYSQLEKYIETVEEYIKGTNKKPYFYLLRPDYNNEDYKQYDKNNRYTEIKYSQIHEIIKDLDLKNYFYSEFEKVVKKHSKEYDNDLFESMNRRFIEQINEIKNRFER